MGGLGFGQGYFGQYSTSGTAPVSVPVTADVLILVQADTGTIQVQADTGTIQVQPDAGSILVET